MPVETTSQGAATAAVADGFDRVSEAASYLGVSRSKLYMMMDSGELTYAKFGRARRIPRAALRSLAERSLIGVRA